MDLASLVALLKELAFLLIVFGALLGYGMYHGTQSLINIILGLYFGLLIVLEFPYKTFTGEQDPLVSIVVFLIFSVLSIFFFSRLMPSGEDGSLVYDLNRKLLYAAGATILVMIYSFHVIPVTNLITPGSPISAIFSPVQYFFWWLITPFVMIFLLRN